MIEGIHMKELTARQREFYDFIVSFVEDKSYPPTIREIQHHFRLKSTKGVKDHIDRLVARGYLNRAEGSARALEVVGKKESKTVDLPVVGRVAAGIPLLADENIEDYFPVSKNLVRTTGMFLLRVNGDSMKNAAILDGDLLLVRPQPFVDQGTIAVVLIDNEATVKRFYKYNDRIELHPENPNYEPIVCNTETGLIRVIGKVTALYREMESR